jgi:hypothetical protein
MHALAVNSRELVALTRVVDILRSDVPLGAVFRLDGTRLTTWSLGDDLRLLFRRLPVQIGPSSRRI